MLAIPEVISNCAKLRSPAADPAAVIQRPAQFFPRRLKLLRRFRVPKLVQPREFQQNVEAADKRPRPASCLRRTHNSRWRFQPLLTHLSTLVSLPRGNKPPRTPCTHLNNRLRCQFGNICCRCEEFLSRSQLGMVSFAKLYAIPCGLKELGLSELLQRHRHVNRVKERTRLSVHLHDGAARNRFTHSRRCRVEIIGVARVLSSDGINAWKRK